MHSRVVVLVALALVAGCFPSVDLDGAVVSCATGSCPDGLVCDEFDRVCKNSVPLHDVRPPGVSVASFSRDDVLGPNDTVSVHLELDEAAATVELFYARTDESRFSVVVAPVDAGGAIFDVVLAPGALDVSGRVDVQATLTDAADNVATVALGVVEFDLDAADVVVADVKYVVNDDNPLFPGNPDSAKNNTGAVVVVTFDEDVDVARAGVDVAAVEGEDGAVEGGVEGVVLDNDRRTATFTFGTDTFDGLSDGPHDLVISATDAHGNSVDLARDGAFVVDNTPPLPPQLELLARFPWGDNAEPGPHTAAIGRVGTNDDTFVVLVVSDGIDVENGNVAFSLARARPDNDLFDVRLPIDVPSLGVIAVDEAGNLSTRAAALRTEVTSTVLDPTSPHRLSSRPRFDGALVARGDADQTDALRAGLTTTTAAALWTPLTAPEPAFPSVPALAWDPTRNAVLAIADGRTFHVVDGRVLEDNAPRLPIRRGGALALDPRRGRVVLFGGADSVNIQSARPRNDVWEWDGDRWVERLPNDPTAVDRPAPRVGSAGVDVPDLGGIVYFGGCKDDNAGEFNACPGGAADDVWRWDGDAFSALCTGNCRDASPLPLPFNPALVVDDEGRLLALGGFVPGIGIGFPSDQPIVPVFSGSLWVTEECADDCAAANPLPPNSTQPLAASAIGGGGIVAFSNVNGVPTRHTYTRAAGFTATPLDGPLSLSNTTQGFGQSAIVIAPNGDVFLASGARELWRVRDNHADLIAPSAGAPVAHAAVSRVVDDVVTTVGGCSGFSSDRDRCEAASAVVQEVVVDGGVRIRADGDVSGRAYAFADVVVASVDNVVTAYKAGVAAGSIVVDVDTAPVALIEDPAGGALLFSGPPFAFGAIQMNDRIDVVEVDGSIENVCAVNCGVAVDEGIGAAAGVVVGDLALNTTTRTVSDGVFTDVLTLNAPQGRRGASLVDDAARDGVWLFGGTVLPPQRFGGDSFSCGGSGHPADCDDVWFFDGADWTQIVTVAGFGLPPPRARATLAAVDGGFVVVGGANETAAINDAWRLQAALDPTPAQLLDVTLAAAGRDADGAPHTATLLWCGAAADAAGAPVDVEFAIWNGANFAGPISIEAEDDCATAEFADADLDVRGVDRRLTALVRPVLTGAVEGAGAGFASLTTTSMELRTAFVGR